ncbi:MAG TPA: methyltransferase domain-containing protein [Gemmatimonadales bacterium]|nr:methyltransferase domain-containing protein [Gemmatimonadales bacterium]
MLSKNPAAYYTFAGIERVEFRELLDAIDREGFRMACHGFFRDVGVSRADAFYRNTFARERAAWKFALSVPDGTIALDLGAGAGAISMALAPHCATVFACDITWERLSLLKRWAAYESAGNVTCVCGGDTDRIPFSTNLCDVIILNGVLEWVPADKSGNPRQCQLNFLREVRRILKPTGQLYIGIENRIGYPYFFGKKEDHTGIRYLSLLPRGLARVVHRMKRQAEFRTYTYSPRGLATLLNTAGFADVTTYCPFPDYRHFSELVPLDGRTRVTQPERPRSISRLVHGVASHPILLRHVSPSLAVVAGNTNGHLLLHDVADALALAVDSASAGPLMVSPTGMVIWRARHRDGTPVIVRLPISPGGRARCEDNFRALTRIHTQPGISASTRRLVPVPLGRVDVKGQFATAESLLPGRQVSVADVGTIAAVWPTLVELIEDVGHVERLEAGDNASDVPTAIERWVAALEAALPTTEEGHGRREIVRKVANALLEVAPSPQFAHGNCTIENIVVDQHARLSGLYDWDLSRWGMFPLIDLLEFGIATRHKHSDDAASFLRPVIPECHPTIERLASLKGLPSNYVHILEAAFLLRMAALKVLPHYVGPERFRAVQQIIDMLARHMRRVGFADITE